MMRDVDELIIVEIGKLEDLYAVWMDLR